MPEANPESVCAGFSGDREAHRFRVRLRRPGMTRVSEATVSITKNTIVNDTTAIVIPGRRRRTRNRCAPAFPATAGLTGSGFGCAAPE